MTISINKYYVTMSEDGSTDVLKSKIVMAEDHFDALNIVKNDKFWHEEGAGKYYRKIKYPITLSATLANDK